MNIHSVQTLSGGTQPLPSTRTGEDTGDVPARQPVTNAVSDSYIAGDTPAPIAETSDRESQADSRQRDEFVPTPAPSPNALYNVADIQRDPDGRIIHTAPLNPAPLRGEQVSFKIADIILSMGRKSLSIFRLEG